MPQHLSFGRPDLVCVRDSANEPGPWGLYQRSMEHLRHDSFLVFHKLLRDSIDRVGNKDESWQLNSVIEMAGKSVG